MAIDTKSPAFYADFGGLATLKGAAQAQDPAALREAARQFESLFTQMMLKSMRQANTAITGGQSLMDNDQSDMYREMFDNQLATQLAKGRGLGLADMLVRQLSQAGLVNGDSQVKGPTVKLPTDRIGALEVKAPGLPLRETASKAAFPVPEARVPTLINSTSGTALPAPPVALWTEVEIDCETTPHRVPAPSSLPSAVSPSVNEPAKALADESKLPAPIAEPKRVEKISAESAKETRPLPLIPQPLAKNAADFVRQLWPHAQQAARELGVDAKTLIAHAALETGWGKFVPCNPDGSCSFNLFGIKASSRWQGAATVVSTLEYENGVAVQKREAFRAYDSPADSFRDYASFIKNSPRYQSALGAGADAETFAAALQHGGYATDPNYATKLASVASRLNAMTEQIPLKVADSWPLTTGRSVSAGEGT